MTSRRGRHSSAIAQRLGGRRRRPHAGALRFEGRLEQRQRVGLVVDEQDVDPVEHGPTGPTLAGSIARLDRLVGVRRRLRALAGGESYVKRGTFTGSRRLVASMVPPCSSHELLADRQAQAEAAVDWRPKRASAWRNGVNTCGRNSGAMPMPVSVMAISTILRRRGQTHRDPPAQPVNFTALLSRFQTPAAAASRRR